MHLFIDSCISAGSFLKEVVPERITGIISRKPATWHENSCLCPDMCNTLVIGAVIQVYLYLSCVFCSLDGNHMTLCCVLLLLLSFCTNLICPSTVFTLHSWKKLRWSKCITIHAKSKSSSTSLLGFNQQAANMHCYKDNRSIVIDKWAHLFNVGAVFNASSTAYLHPIISIPRPQSDIFF